MPMNTEGEFIQPNNNDSFLDIAKIVAALEKEHFPPKRASLAVLMLTRIAIYPCTYSTRIARSVSWVYKGIAWKNLVHGQRSGFVQQIEDISVQLIRMGVLQEIWKKRFVPKNPKGYDGVVRPQTGLNKHVGHHTRLLALSPKFLLPGYPESMVELTTSPEWMKNKNRDGVFKHAMRGQAKQREIERARDAILGQKPGFGKLKGQSRGER